MNLPQRDFNSMDEKKKRLVIYGLVYSFVIGTITVFLMYHFLFHVALIKAIVATMVVMIAGFTLYWIFYK